MNYGLFIHTSVSDPSRQRYYWDERLGGKTYVRKSAAEKAANAMNARGEHGGMVVVRTEDYTQTTRHRNPGFTAKEERQYKDIVKSGRRRYGARAKEVAARTVLKGRRSVRRGSKRSNPPKKYETTLNGVHVKFFQGYAEDVRYIREADGKPYSHVVETDSAELYLAEHSVYGRCILIVDPSGKTPLWG